MAEQQIVDYIIKAKGIGQTDDQTRNLLLKNGWTETEISDAFASLVKPAESKPVEQPVSIVQEPKSQPQSQPQVQPQPVIVEKPQPAVQTMTVIKILMVLIIIIVLGGLGVFVGAKYINLPWNPFWPNPTTVVNNMMTNMKNVKSSHMAVQGEINASINNVSQGNLSFNISGEGDKTDINNIKSNAAISVNVTAPSFPGGNISVKMDTVILGETLYFKINSLTAPSDFVYPGLDISKITNIWFKFDHESLEVLTEEPNGQSNLPDMSQINNSELTRKFQDLLLTENMFSISKQLGDETVSGQGTYHYLATISKDKLKDFLNRAITAQTTADTTIDPLVTSIATSMVGTVTDAIGDVNFEMWVGKSDYLLYGLKIDKTIDLSKVYAGLPAIGLKINETNNNFNKPITVKAPENAQKIESLFLPLTKNQAVSSDLLDIQTIASSLSPNYSSLCTKGLLNGYLPTYGSQLVSLHADIIKQGAGKPSCYASTSNFCVSTQLPDGSYLCTGNNGAGDIKCTSSATRCEHFTIGE
ncbi:MAG: hypothetical protein NTW11_04185 [Candidatus Staskawiczbacteria bacterium]|nr:hypothetical protein [Candidatus Staskawiczbacteria bacterium]